MRVFGFVILFLSVVQFSYAQEEVKSNENHLMVETQYLLRKDSSYVPNIKFRYVFNNDGALRVTGSYSYSSTKQELLESGGDGVGNLERISDLFRMSVGYEKFFNHERFSSYVGGELIFGIGKSDVYGSRTDSLSYVPDFNFSSKTPVSQFGVQLFTGVDVKLFDGLYIGTELGLNFLNSNQKRGLYRAEDGSSTTASVVEEDLPGLLTKKFFVGNLGLVRIGWRF